MKEGKTYQQAEKILVGRASSCTDENMGLKLTSDMSKKEVRETLLNARKKMRADSNKS